MNAREPGAAPAPRALVTYDTDPSRYAHWSLQVDGEIARLAMDVNEDAGIRPGYKLKLNSYDLGVDIELADALNRIRFEHPGVRCVVLTSAKDRVFCSGANIYMLGTSSHAWKVNFCRFTNETRNGMEDSSRHEGLRFLAAMNGTTAGGGYELALACDELVMIDDRSSAVSLPEVPLLGVLPGTGGLTRLTDKRRVRRDHADVFCTVAEGVRAQRALEWKLVDHAVRPAEFAARVEERARSLAATSSRERDAKGIALAPLPRRIDESGYRYSTLEVDLDRAARTATITVHAPEAEVAADPQAILAAGSRWYPLALARELDDAILMLRTNELEIGTWILKTRGEAQRALAMDAALLPNRGHWLVRETLGWLRRALARLEVSSRTIFAIADRGSCFAGTLAELAFAADRIYMLDLPADDPAAPRLTLSPANLGLYPTLERESRLEARFYGDAAQLAAVRDRVGQPLAAQAALALGLVTSAPDDIDWDDEVRLAIEERASLSPDALTGMEQNLRFGGPETLHTRIFGRLSAWQNWIFNRPNAVGEAGALKVFGTGNKTRFNWERV